MCNFDAPIFHVFSTLVSALRPSPFYSLLTRQPFAFGMRLGYIFFSFSLRTFVGTKTDAGISRNKTKLYSRGSQPLLRVAQVLPLKVKFRVNYWIILQNVRAFTRYSGCSPNSKRLGNTKHNVGCAYM